LQTRGLPKARYRHVSKVALRAAVAGHLPAPAVVMDSLRDSDVQWMRINKVSGVLRG